MLPTGPGNQPTLRGSMTSAATDRCATFLAKRPPAMKAQELIQGATFGPDTLKIIGQAFDEAWKNIAGNFGENPLAIEAARLKLANAILSVANEGSRDVELLKNAALESIALDYRSPE